MIEPHDESERGLSIAVTHVLTIGITTILIAMLLMSGSALLESETDRSTQTSLETVGERLAGEIANVDQIADNDNDVTITVDHPRTVANSQYTVEIRDDCDDIDESLIDHSNECLELTSQNTDVTVYVPLALDNADQVDGAVTGGEIRIEYEYDDGDGEISISEANR